MIRQSIVVAALLGGCLCLAHAQTPSKERIEAFAKLPDWSGLWEFDAYVGESVGQILSPEGLHKAKAYAAAMHPSFTPAWQPKYEKAKKEFEDAVAADPNEPPAPGSSCGVAPFPATMLPGFYEWRVTPEETTLISSQGSVRHIYTDGRPHLPANESWPTSQGNSIGHWDGDTLVVDTIAIKDPFIFMAVEPFEFAFTTGPLSNELHTVERIRMVNHDEMQIQFTMEDPVALARPINMTITYERVRNFNLMEDTRNADCDAATDRNPIVNGRFTTIVKPAPVTPTEPDKQGPVGWHDASPHSVQFVTVDKDVKLEVLDWGGTGLPVVLLTGLGNTAHIYDDFAPKLTAQYHVYGITRRGYGASSAPVPDDKNYLADRLGDDVMAVLGALKISRPILVGHSIAGEELSSIGSRHPERVAGLIYLDAGYWYAYYDRSLGSLGIDGAELRRKLGQLATPGAPDPRMSEELLQNDIPALERDLRAARALPRLPGPPQPTPSDLVSFQALGAWFVHGWGITVPEAELRATSAVNPGGEPSGQKTPASIPQAIVEGEEKYTEIRVPVLAIFALPHDFGPVVDNDPEARAAAEGWDAALSVPQAKAFEMGVPSARVVRLPHANHYVFISNEADVLREMRAFMSGLPQ
jgi:non-heme chloroperoxidase